MGVAAPRVGVAGPATVRFCLALAGLRPQPYLPRAGAHGALAYPLRLLRRHVRPGRRRFQPACRRGVRRHAHGQQRGRRRYSFRGPGAARTTGRRTGRDAVVRRHLSRPRHAAAPVCLHAHAAVASDDGGDPVSSGAEPGPEPQGHVAGDALLTRLGQMIHGCLRQIDAAGRYGGDAFCVLLPMTGLEDAHAVLERLRQQASESEWGDIELSIGIVAYHPQMQSVEDCIRAADKALYLAKHQGHNRVISSNASPSDGERFSVSTLV
ncbi:hypothetical protein DNK44_19095 [Pseudomonas dryadis]|uniref:diguanylate cyclase n=1 Tax=Phytopseudomonas dryadis TaxID=2487520 RepID=A0A4Q9QYB9_9GAMM|nr:hypothetical protein DNK44_19095 [Pseudomonas dryadis]